MKRLALLVLPFTSVTAPVFGQVSLDQMASEFERPLDCGQRIWTEQEVASFLEAAVSYAPHIAANPRIAGTPGIIADNTRSGYYGGVYFGPIQVSDRQIDYYRMTIWGDIERGWTFNQHAYYRAVRSDSHPTWLLLEDSDLRDDFQITEEMALTIIGRVRDMVEQEARSADGELLVPLTEDEIDHLHRFEASYWTPRDVEFADSEPPPWWEGHMVITAKSQQPDAHHNVYQSAVQFAITDEGLTFVRTIPKYDVFEYLGLRRSGCN